MQLVHLNRGQIIKESHERRSQLRAVERNIYKELSTTNVPNLLDVFSVIPKEAFPKLWAFVVKFLTVIPTSVACEQSFSYFRRTIHTNMSEETGMVFLFKRLELYGNDFLIQRKGCI